MGLRRLSLACTPLSLTRTPPSLARTPPSLARTPLSPACTLNPALWDPHPPFTKQVSVRLDLKANWLLWEAVAVVGILTGDGPDSALTLSAMLCVAV